MKNECHDNIHSNQQPRYVLKDFLEGNQCTRLPWRYWKYAKIIASKNEIFVRGLSIYCRRHPTKTWYYWQRGDCAQMRARALREGKKYFARARANSNILGFKTNYIKTFCSLQLNYTVVVSFYLPNTSSLKTTGLTIFAKPP